MVRRKIRAAVTDSGREVRYDPAAKPGITNLIEVMSVATPRDFESLADAFEAMFTSSPTRGELTRAMSEAERDQYAAELRRRLVRFVQPGGRCVLPGEALLGAGARR